MTEFVPLPEDQQIKSNAIEGDCIFKGWISSYNNRVDPEGNPIGKDYDVPMIADATDCAGTCEAQRNALPSHAQNLSHHMQVCFRRTMRQSS